MHPEVFAKFKKFSEVFFAGFFLRFFSQVFFSGFFLWFFGIIIGLKNVFVPNNYRIERSRFLCF